MSWYCVTLLALLLVPLADLQSVDEGTVDDAASDQEETESLVIEQPTEVEKVIEEATDVTDDETDDVIEEATYVANDETEKAEISVDDVATCESANTCDDVKESIPPVEEPVDTEVSSDSDKESGMFGAILKFLHLA